MEQKEIKILSTEPIKNESEFAELVPSEILKEIREKIQTMEPTQRILIRS